MKLSILQQDLYPALSAVARSVGVRSTLPVLGNILIQTENGKLKLSATNLEIGVVKLIKAEVEEDGEVTVPAKTLVDLVSNLGNETITLEGSTDQLKITSSGTFASSLNGIPAVEFPSIPLSGKNKISISPQVLKDSLPQVTFAAAHEEGRPVLTGVLTEIKNKKLELVATDGYRLSHRSVEIEEEASFKALIPKRTFEEVVRLIMDESVDQVTISTSEDQNQVVFDLGLTLLSSRLIEGQFPAWEKIIPTKTLARIVAEKDELLKAVKIASVFARTEANIIKLENKENLLTLSSEAKELGSQSRQISCQTEGEQLSVAFNAKFLIDALSSLKTSQVILELSGNLSAAIIKPMGEEGLEHIIMPVNLS